MRKNWQAALADSGSSSPAAVHPRVSLLPSEKPQLHRLAEGHMSLRVEAEDSLPHLHNGRENL